MLILALLVALSNHLFSQNSFSGKVTDGKEDVFFATVALYNVKDSSIVQAESTDESGQFFMKNIKDGDYYLEATMLGYTTAKVDNINFPENNQKTFDLTLSADSKVLKEVEVTARKPLLEQRADRLVVNVENNLTSLNGSVLDVMKKVPGMIVVGDNLRMAGQQNITILINGKTTRYMDVQSLLKDMPGDNIKKVEVIHQPGAEFDAEGTGPVINIILKKNNLFGTNGRIALGAAKGEYWRHQTSLSLSHYQGDVNIHGGVGFRRNSWWDRMDITRNVAGDIYQQVSDDPSLSNILRGNLALDWNVTEKHTMGFSSRIINSESDYVVDNETLINFLDPTEDDLMLITQNAQIDDWRLMTINPYYSFEIDTAGQKLDFDFSVSQIDVDQTNTLTSTEVNALEIFPSQKNIQVGLTQIWTAQLDYTLPISKNAKFQFGGKYSDASLDNDLEALIEDSENWINYAGQSNHFLFDETIAAGYGKLTWKMKEWNGTLGLRYEDSYSEGYSVTIDSTLTRDIAKLFPSASIGRNIAGDLGATMAYSYRIDRPRYNNLNPFKYFLDQFTFSRGNENLAPALTHSMKFNLHFQNQPFFNIEYKHTNDAIVEVSEQNDEAGTSNLVTVNLETFKNFNVSLFFPLDFIPKVSGYGGFIANYGKFDSEYLNDQFVRSKWDYTGFISAELTLPFDINSQISGWYNSGGQDGIVNAQWLYGVDVGFSKKFMEQKAKFSVGVENLFARYLTAEIEYANMDIDIHNRWDGPVINAQFSYKFGNQHVKRRKGHNNSGADVLNRAGQN
ncbi:MAG: outer membrane beta-barrel protein [Bacteroidota bacterium]